MMYGTIQDFIVNIIGLSAFPTFLYTLHYYNIIAFGTVQIFLLIFVGIFVIFPLIFKYSYNLQRSSVFLRHANVDPYSDFIHPSKYGLTPARNFYLVTSDPARLGVWHILPQNFESTINETDEQYPYPESVLNNGQNIVIYCHGNAGNRVNDYRIELYKVLRMQFHVITFDYRSYGDSSDDEATEQKVVEDAIFVYSWIANRTKSNIFIWGHSLGSSIAIQTAVAVQERGIRKPTGLFLEAPFNNMRDEIGEFPLAKIFSYFPWFSFTVIEPMIKNGFRFESDRFICHVNSPITVLHAEDDSVVPYKLGRKLYESAQSCRQPSQGSVSFKTFEARYGYNHRHICRDPELRNIIRKFVDRALEESQKIR